MAEDNLPIYLLPGMTREYPVYSKLLPLLPGGEVVQFIEPKPNESLTAYAQRMATQFPQPCFIGGVSFGGILAQEISRIIQPAGCIVISSIRQPSQLPPWFRIWRLLGRRQSAAMLNAVGKSANLIPASIHLGSTHRLHKLSGESGAWHRWATTAVLDWSPTLPLDTPVLHVHGSADTTFPIRYTAPDVVVQGGRHNLPISHPAETADAILNFIRR